MSPFADFFQEKVHRPPHPDTHTNNITCVCPATDSPLITVLMILSIGGVSHIRTIKSMPSEHKTFSLLICLFISFITV